MDKAQQRRWFVLLSILAGTVGAIFYPVDEVPLIPPRKPGTVPVSAHTRQEKMPVERPRDWLAAQENPFAPRGWVAPPAPSPAQARTVAPVVLPEAPPPPAPPEPLPFRFLGQMSDGDDRVIYLGQGDRVLPARLGDLLEGRYKVVAIQAAQIDFENTTSGLRQSLPLPPQDK